jgi:hypothetical protein
MDYSLRKDRGDGDGLIAFYYSNKYIGWLQTPNELGLKEGDKIDVKYIYE